MQTMKAYHGVTSSEHQTQFNLLSKKGYRMISISVYGSSSNPRYAAVWVLRSGPEYSAAHGLNAQQYQDFFNQWTSKGFVPILISATGNPGSEIFATVFEKKNVGSYQARHGMTAGNNSVAFSFESENKIARDHGFILKSVTIYGSSSDRRYAAIWHTNTNFTKWNTHSLDTATQYQASFDAETQLNFRPAINSISEDQFYCSVFKDEPVGRWVARHGITSAKYQAEFDKYTKEGLYPIYVDGGGSGSNTRYSVVFAETDIPLPRKWTVKGSKVAALNSLDQVVKSFMQDQNIRCMQLSIRRGGVSKLNRAYTWAESNYRKTEVTDTFLLASCSKLYVAAAIQFLYDNKSLKPSDSPYAILGFSSPKKATSDKITIQQLLDHTAGYHNGSTSMPTGYDPTYDMRTIAKFYGYNHKVNKMDIAKYMYKEKELQYSTGTSGLYSNYGYLLLSLIVEKKTGQDYYQFLNSKIIPSSYAKQVKAWPTVANPRASNEVYQEDAGLNTSAVLISSNALVPNVYGGDHMVKEVAVGSCGLAASADSMAEFIGTHAVWGNGGRAAGAARTGSTPGASTLAKSRSDKGIDWAYCINSRAFKNSDALSKLGTAIDDAITAAGNF